MARSRRYQKGTLYKEGDWWKLRWYEGVFDPALGRAKRKQSKPYTIGRCKGAGSLTKKQAQKAQREKMDIVNAHFGPDSADSIGSIGKFVEKKFLKAYVPTCAKSGQLHYEGLLSKHIVPAFGDMLPEELKRDAVQTWINAKAKEKNGFSKNHLIHMRNCLVTVYNYMAACGYEGRNPAQGVKMPKEARKRRRPGHTRSRMNS